MRKGEYWSREEDMNLLVTFDKGATCEELAAKHERTEAVILARLLRFQRIAPKGANRWHRLEVCPWYAAP